MKVGDHNKGANMTGELTYRRLLNYLKILEADESSMLDLDVTVKLDDEFRSIAHIMVTHEDDVLDKDHPYFITCDAAADDDENDRMFPVWEGSGGWEGEEDTEDRDEEPTYESELNRTPWTAYKSPNRW